MGEAMLAGSFSAGGGGGYKGIDLTGVAELSGNTITISASALESGKTYLIQGLWSNADRIGSFEFFAAMGTNSEGNVRWGSTGGGHQISLSSGTTASTLYPDIISSGDYTYDILRVGIETYGPTKIESLMAYLPPA